MTIQIIWKYRENGETGICREIGTVGEKEWHGKAKRDYSGKAAEQAKHLLKKKQLRSVHVIGCRYTYQPTSPSRRNIGIRNLGSKCARL